MLNVCIIYTYTYIAKLWLDRNEWMHEIKWNMIAKYFPWIKTKVEIKMYNEKCIQQKRELFQLVSSLFSTFVPTDFLHLQYLSHWSERTESRRRGDGWNKNETKKWKKSQFYDSWITKCSTNDLWNDLPVEIQRRVQCIHFFSFQMEQIFYKAFAKINVFQMDNKEPMNKEKNKFNGHRNRERKKETKIWLNLHGEKWLLLFLWVSIVFVCCVCVFVCYVPDYYFLLIGKVLHFTTETIQIDCVLCVIQYEWGKNWCRLSTN